MPGLSIELTNRCNLSCKHCFDDRHNKDGENLAIDIIEKIVKDAKNLSIDHISFTGGEPTIHPEFMKIVKVVSEAGLKFGFVTNGLSFTAIYEELLAYCSMISSITFSLDGANKITHEKIRGKGTYHRVMKAISICVVKDIPFTINTVILSYNRNELDDIAKLAMKLGSLGLRFGHHIATPMSKSDGLDLSFEERKESENIICRLQKQISMPIVMAPGYYTRELFPCSPLQLEECNIDWQGNVTFCCHLSGHGNKKGKRDVVASLEEMDFFEAYTLWVNLNKEFKRKKSECYKNGELNNTDYFSCLYCLKYFNK